MVVLDDDQEWLVISWRARGLCYCVLLRGETMATPLPSIECSAQPLSISFHPHKEIVAAGLVDGTIEIHDLIAPPLPNLKEDDSKNNNNDDDDDDSMDSDDNEVADTILASITVAKEVPQSKMDTKMLAKSDSTTTTATSKATQGPSCRCVLFSNSPLSNNNDDGDNTRGGEYIYTACNNGSLKCLDSERACNSLNQFHNKDNQSSNNPILWSIDNAHNVGINKMFQLPHSSPCGAAIVTGDDVGTVRLWDTRICGNNNSNQNHNSQSGSNPFDNLMKLPTGCIQHWKVNHDYITDFETNIDGTTLFASSADGTLSVFDIRYINKKGGTSRCISLPDIDPHQPISSLEQKNNTSSTTTWEKHGYVKSDNQEDELLSLVLLKNSTKLLCGSQQGILSLFSYNIWGDISDRFPGHPQSIDALLKIDEDTVLTGSSDGLVRCVQLLPNALLGVLGSHDGFPIEGLGWSCNRNMVGSISHDEYIRLWDASLLKEEDDDSDDDEGNMVEDEEDDHIKSSRISNKAQGVASSRTTTATTTKAQHDDSEDDWEDMDEDKDRMDSDDDDDSDSDDDSNDGGGGGKQKKRQPVFKSQNDAFFSDL